MSGSSYDIALIGMGPVGATAAIHFAAAGLSVAIFERDPDIYALPRAVAMDGEIVRLFQAIGRGEELASCLQKLRPGDRAGFANADREWLFGQDLSPTSVNGWQNLSMFDQPEIEEYLRKTIGQYDTVDVFLGEEEEGFEDLGDRVLLRTSEREVSSSYLVACDGAASSTRKVLDLDWKDLGYDHDWLVVDVVINEKNTLNQDTVQVCAPERLATYVVTKDPFRRWEFKLNPGETREQMLEDETIQKLIDPWTPRDSYTIRRKAVYQFHAATAEAWRRGRVFIAGDAAHQTPPFLGQGMNAGMRDVFNLAWKLPLVLKGQCDEKLLDTYQSERLAHAEDLVEWAVAIGELMQNVADVAAAEQAGDPPPPVLEQKKSAGYGQGREAPPLRDGVLLVKQVSDNGSTGDLFSQPIVENQDAQRFMLDDLFGPGFSLVCRQPPTLSDQSNAIIEGLGITVVSLEGLKEVDGHFDQLFEHSDAAIVRPDRYVFGHTENDLDPDQLIELLAERLYFLNLSA